MSNESKKRVFLQLAYHC